MWKLCLIPLTPDKNEGGQGGENCTPAPWKLLSLPKFQNWNCQQLQLKKFRLKQ